MASRSLCQCPALSLPKKAISFSRSSQTRFLRASAFKANKLPQILLPMREEFMQSAGNATKKALDPNLRGHIDVAGFIEGGDKQVRVTAMKMRMKELNKEAMRTQIMSEVLQKEVEARAAQAAAERRQRTPPRNVSSVSRLSRSAWPWAKAAES